MWWVICGKIFLLILIIYNDYKIICVDLEKMFLGRVSKRIFLINVIFFLNFFIIVLKFF